MSRLFLNVAALACASALAYACGSFTTDAPTPGADAGGPSSDAGGGGASDGAGGGGDAVSDADAGSDGGGGPVPLDGSVGRAHQYVWVVPLASRAAFTGIDMADTRCGENIPSGKGIGKAKALVVGSTRTACTTPGCTGGAAEHKDWPLLPNTQYRRTDDTVIGQTNGVGIFPAGLTNSIGTTESVYVWTGLAVGNPWTTGMNCNDWTSSLATDYGTAGYTSPAYVNAGQPFGAFLWECSNVGALYCVESP